MISLSAFQRENGALRLPLLFCATVAAVSLLTVRATTAADKPNIVILLADDLGNADLGDRGSQIKTPNIDTLATGGPRLESYYGLPPRGY